MKIKFDENYYVEGFCTLGDMEGAVEFHGAVPDDFAENHRFYRFDIDKWVLDLEKKSNEEIKTDYINERTNLVNFMFETDYVAIKIAEGAATKEDYADILQQRQQARGRINDIDIIMGGE